jgi:hypothetical protein
MQAVFERSHRSYGAEDFNKRPFGAIQNGIFRFINRPDVAARRSPIKSKEARVRVRTLQERISDNLRGDNAAMLHCRQNPEQNNTAASAESGR